jgi:hypothetical protein
MVDVTEEQRASRQTPRRLVGAVIFGITVAALVASRATSELNGQSAVSWLVHFWLFEFVFGVTVTLVATWGRDDDLRRARRERQLRRVSPRDYV